MGSGVCIPFVNLSAQHRALKDDLLNAVDRVLGHGQFILGPEVAEFERCFAQICGVRHAIGVGNGTDALVLALRVLNIGPGDEVITTPNSFVSTAAAIALAGARPVFVDTADDLNIDVHQIERAINPRCRAILPVHLTGRPADMGPLMNIAREHSLHVIEDGAQAVGAEYNGRRVGSFGTIGCFSFHPLKTLNACGDGGILTTDDPQLDERLRVMRNIGLKTREDCVEWSGNSRLDTLQAAMLLVKLPHLEDWIAARRANAREYCRLLGDVPLVRLPIEHANERGVYHTFVIQAEQRDELRAFLASRGIRTAIHYRVPIHLQPASRALGYGRGSFPVAERQAERMLSLPIYPELSRDDLAYVAAAIRDFYMSSA
ncbi:MAG: DegT/DnrJ/EryC1/StrS family aminotransferase [Acidobacteria bacterium]|nr:MAG: DegT/DnrJ/EryC1/StrS family aminotransferase [Acidobacteriota bacterium]